MNYNSALNRKIKSHILPLIIFSQFCGTSLWFAVNAILPELILAFNLSPSSVGHLTSAIQLGFILGTLTFALLNIADRFSPSKVFFHSAILAALSNFALLHKGNSFESIFLLRLLCGFFLAGIYPIGMKIAADYYEGGLGRSLSFLVAALVLGTAFPHFLNSFENMFELETLVIFVSSIASFGGFLMLLFVPDGPFRKKSNKMDIKGTLKLFKSNKFLAAGLGYFGHMWELYAFWTFVPFLIKSYITIHKMAPVNSSALAFGVIAMGSIGCIVGGILSSRFSEKRISKYALMLSGICCLLSPVFFLISNFYLFYALLLIWGMAVIADSPLLSTLVANNSEGKLKGTAITLVNSIGFATTIFSIQLLNQAMQVMNEKYIYLLLAPGPFLGWYFLSRKNSAIHLKS